MKTILNMEGKYLKRDDIIRGLLKFAGDKISAEETAEILKLVAQVKEESLIMNETLQIREEAGQICIFQNGKILAPQKPTDDWLVSQGFQPDKMGTLTKGFLHIELGTRPEAPTPYACIRSAVIPVPTTCHDVLDLLRLLGLS